MNYENKENYITVNPSPDIWKMHPNYFIMNFYKQYIKGVCGDLGCNHGACTVLLLDFAEHIESIHGFDLNYRALEVAYNMAVKINPPIKVSFVQTNLTKIPMENEFFDFLMSFHVLEHIYSEDIDKVLDEIWRILKPQGTILISIPYDHAYPDPAHVAFYNVDSLSALFEKHNFEVIECMKDNRWHEKNLLTGVFRKISKTL